MLRECIIAGLAILTVASGRNVCRPPMLFKRGASCRDCRANTTMFSRCHSKPDCFLPSCSEKCLTSSQDCWKECCCNQSKNYCNNQENIECHSVCSESCQPICQPCCDQTINCKKCDGQACKTKWKNIWGNLHKCPRKNETKESIECEKKNPKPTDLEDLLDKIFDDLMNVLRHLSSISIVGHHAIKKIIKEIVPEFFHPGIDKLFNYLISQVESGFPLSALKEHASISHIGHHAIKKIIKEIVPDVFQTGIDSLLPYFINQLEGEFPLSALNLKEQESVNPFGNQAIKIIKEIVPDVFQTGIDTLLHYLIKQVEGGFPLFAKKEKEPVDAFLSGIAPALKSLSSHQLHLAKSELFAIAQKFEAAALAEPQAPQNAFSFSIPSPDSSLDLPDAPIVPTNNEPVDLNNLSLQNFMNNFTNN